MWWEGCTGGVNKQESRQAGRQASKEARKQASTWSAFSRSHALKGLVSFRSDPIEFHWAQMTTESLRNPNMSLHVQKLLPNWMEL